MLKREINIIKQKSGMTLVEVLTAMTILTLVIFCFSPLFLSYYNSIVIAGNEMKDVYEDSGYLQKVISSRKEDIDEYAKHYSGNFNHVMTVKSPTSGTEVSINASGKFLGGAIDEESTLRPFETGYVTAVSKKSNRILCFPTTITDDFKEKFITVVYDGGTFDSGDFSSEGPYKLYVTQNGTREPLTSGQEYTIARYKDKDNKDQDDMLLITLRGGSDICFENSPLVFDYNNGEAVKEIEIDAPTAIMVGEKASDNEYYYYVTRGHVDKDGKLEIIQKSMTGAPLTSAMNDVSWVSADASDGYKDTDEAGNPTLTSKEKYGYYIMCGDNGQVRRFWRNENTGNYYWGGDFTYNTTIINDEENSSNSKYISELKKSIGVSYKYAYHDDFTPTGDPLTSGFVLTRWRDTGIGKNNDVSLVSCNVMSLTALQDFDSVSGLARMYVSDGKIYYSRVHKEANRYLASNSDSLKTYSGMESAITAGKIDGKTIEKLGFNNTLSTDLFMRMNQATRWFKYGSDEINKYFDWTGQQKNDNLITLTCAEGIQMTGNLSSSNGYYTTSADFGNSGGKTGTSSYYSGTLEYPTKSYSLYCGYVPAVMDVWATSSYVGKNGVTLHDNVDYNKGTENVNSFKDSSIASQAVDGTAYYTDSSYKHWSVWKGTFGIIPYGNITGSNVGERIVMFRASRQPSWFEDWRNDTVLYYPYKNINYGILGKFWDGTTSTVPVDFSNISNLLNTYGLTVSSIEDSSVKKQQYTTAGRVIDITVSYLSNPLAIHRSLNPTDDKSFDMSNDRKNFIFLWSNSRDTATYLDIASTKVPNGDKDIPITLMVGYTMGGLTEVIGGHSVYANTIMNNGLVLLRAGSVDAGYPTSLSEGLLGLGSNRNTNEEKAVDHDGYKLDSESNVFHQFYYLNSRTKSSDGKEPYRGAENHVGDLYGANYWENNRHINYVSVNGGEPDDPSKTNTGSYNYLRCHPLSNTKVNCVEWGVTWDDNPEAMWGTENGTLLSWDVDIDKMKDSKVSSVDWNDRSVDAEFQSYKWILNVSGVGAEKGELGEAKTFAIEGSSTALNTNYKETIGAHSGKKNDYAAQKFVLGKDIPEVYMGFYDKWTRLSEIWKGAGFISILETINDIEYSDDIWVAAGNQSGQNPATFCPPGTKRGNVTVKPYINLKGDGKGGSWINVRMWYDVKGTGKYAEYNADGSIKESNTEYYWSAVQISTNPNYNIQQINCINGIWMATGYVDKNNNGEYDDGEKTVICWTRDPSIPCGMPGGWSEDVAVWKYQGGSDPWHQMTAEEIGGINSVATRD